MPVRTLLQTACDLVGHLPKAWTIRPHCNPMFGRAGCRRSRQLDLGAPKACRALAIAQRVGISLVIFWASLGAIVFTLGFFPAIVALRALVIPRPYRAGDVEPTISIVIAARNESAAIGDKLDNIAHVDYPAGSVEVIVASDGSDDATNEIVKGCTDRRFRLVELGRVGKAAALDAAVSVSSGEILVFSDANSMFSTDAIRELVRPFADPEVGGVAGNQQYQRGGMKQGAGESGYWVLETALKAAETRRGSAISATGAIYAIRRSLYEPPPDGVTDDFAISTGVIARGKRLVFAPRAIAFEPVASSQGIEYGRKVRIMTRGLRAVLFRKALLNPRRSGFYAVQLLIHKVFRRLIVFPLAMVAASTPALVDRGLFYQVAAVAQVTVYGAGILGLVLARTRLGRVKLLSMPAFFCMVNFAAAHAAWNVLTGHRIIRWEPARASAGKQA